MDLVRITHNNEKLPKLLASDMPVVLPLFASYEEVKRDNLYKINAEVVMFYVDYLKQMPFMFIEDYNKYDEGQCILLHCRYLKFVVVYKDMIEPFYTIGDMHEPVGENQS